MSNQTITACIVVIGNEILSGRTHDKNTHWLAGQLTKLGIQVREARVVPDVEAVIVATLRECSAKWDYVFTTGGIGPTHDDITADSVAAAFNTTVELNPQAHQLLKDHYKEQLNEARLKMARIPKGATLFDNPISAAPGFKLGNVHVMAGVPSIMRAMFDSFKHTLKGGPPVLSKTVSGTATEGQIATELTTIQAAHEDVEIGSYPFIKNGQLGVSLVMRGLEMGAIDAVVEKVTALLKAHGELFVDMVEGESV